MIIQNKTDIYIMFACIIENGIQSCGIPEMIDHQQNGYVAKYKDVTDLAAGIQYVLTHDMREAALHKAASAYGETHVAQKYINVYESR